MTPSLMTKLIKDMDNGSIQEKWGSKPVRPNNSDQQEPFKISYSEKDSPESGKSQKTKQVQEVTPKMNENSETDKKNDKTDIQANLLSNVIADPAIPINPLTGFVPPPSAEPGTDKTELLKSSNAGDNLLMSADLMLPGNDTSFSNQKVPSQIEEGLKTVPNKNIPVGFDLKAGNGKPEAIPAGIEPENKKEVSLLDKSISDLSIKGAVGGKSGDEKESSGKNTPEENLSDQSGSTGPFSLIPLDKPQENTPSRSYGLIHQNEGELNRSPLSTHDLPPEEKQVLQQLTGWLTNHRGNELQSIRLNLSPETLGTIQIDLSVQNQQVKAELVASSEQVKDLLEKHQDLLRNGLADNGLRVDQFTVRLEEPASYQSGGSMNFHNRFFQRESHPNGNFWSPDDAVTTFTRFPLPADGTGSVSGNSQGGVSIYI